MKKILLFCLCLISVLVSSAQESSINQNFDASCASIPGFPPGWILINTLAGPTYPGSWMCTSTNGRDSTPGMQCSGDFSGSYHLDTSLLITPELYLSDYADNVYLQFDTKTTFIGGNLLAVIKSPDSSFHDSTTTTLGIAPPLDTNWTTRQVDLTAYKDVPFYIAFRYVSDITTGTIWYLDNVFTTPWALHVVTPGSEKLPLTVIGNPTSSAIKISYSTGTAGTYDLILYDVMGRRVYKETLETHAVPEVYTISNLSLVPGMYFIKLENVTSYGVVKAIVE